MILLHAIFTFWTFSVWLCLSALRNNLKSVFVASMSQEGVMETNA